MIVGFKVSAATVWSPAVTIESIEAVHHGGFKLRTTVPLEFCCAASKTEVNVVAGQELLTTEGVRSILSVSLAAFTSGNQVEVFYSQTNPCYVARIRVTK